MKKLFYSILAAAAALFTVACHQETATRFEEGGLADVSFQVSLPGLQTKAFGDGTTADSLVVMVYKVNGGNYEYLPEVKPIPEDPEFDNLTATVNLKLVRGLSYRILFWAQNSYPGLYEIDPEQGTVAMVLPEGGIPANDEEYDAFFVNWEGSVGNEPIQEAVELRRPFAQVNVIAPKADAEAAIANGITPGGSSMKVTAPTKLNLISGEVSEEKEIEFYEMPIDEPVNIPGYEPAEYDYIAMNYIFADAETALLNQLEFAVYEDGGNMIGDPFQLTNVPVCRNYRTVLIGNVFSVDATFEVTIISEFGDSAVVPLEDAEDQFIVLDGTAGSLNGEPGIGSILIDDPQAPGSFNTTLQIGDKLDFDGVFVSDAGVDPHFTSTEPTVGDFAANPGDAPTVFTALAAGETQVKVHFNAVINGVEQTKAESKNYKSAEVIVNITVEAEPEPSDQVFVKVTSAPTDWSGDYLIVYEAGALAFDGSLPEKLDVSNNGFAVVISNGSIAYSADVVKGIFTIAAMDGGYSIKAANGKYIYGSSGKNELKEDAEAKLNTIALDASGNAVITSNTSFIQYNSTSGQERFRYYKSGTATQNPVALYKLVDGGAVSTTFTVTIDPAIVENETTIGGVWIVNGTDETESEFEAGATVELIYDPVGDYQLTKLYYLDGNQEPVDIEFAEGVATFVMPAYSVTIYATFEEPGDTDTYTVTIDPAIIQEEENVGGVWIEGGNDLVYEYNFEEGDTVNLVYDPIGDYDLTALYYFDDNQEPVDIAFADGEASFEMPAYAITIYATFEEPSDDEIYALFDGAIVEGDYVIVYGETKYAMNNVVDANNRIQYESVTIVNDAIVNPDASIIWHIAPNGGNWTIYSADAEKYAASTGVKNKAAVIADGTDAKAQWTITKQAATDTAPVTYEIENVSNKAAGVNSLLRNNGTYGFACYAAAMGGTLSLYKLVDGDEPQPQPQDEYYISLFETNFGTLSCDKENNYAAAGDIVTVTLTPGENCHYVQSSLLIATEASPNGIQYEISESQAAAGVYIATFTMPAEDVTVTAEFDEDSEPAGYVYTGSGTAADPYTVEDVRHFIDELNGQTSTDVVYVQGVVTSLTSYTFTSGSTASFFIADSANSEDTFEAYKVQYVDKKTYDSSYPDVAVNDAVIVAGKVKLYTKNNNSTYETTGDSDSFVYSLNGQTSVPPVVSALDINNVPAAGVTDATTTVAFINADGWDVSVAPDGNVVTAASIDGTTITYSVAQNTSEDGVKGYIGVTLSKQGETDVEEMIVVGQLGAGQEAPAASWEVVTDFSSIESGGKYIFVNVQSNKSYYMESATCAAGGGTKCVELAKLPTDPEFVLEDKMYVILTASDTQAGFTVSNSDGKQLVITAANNGLGFVDEGTVVNFHGVTKENVTTGYTLTGKDTNDATRYIGMNSTTNFRCYTSENNNVKTGTFVWYHYIGE